MKKQIIVFIAYLTVGFLIYGRGLNYPFLLDDFFQIELNTKLRLPFLFRELFLSDYWNAGTSSGAYRPFLKTMFWVQYQLWGLNPIPYRCFLILVLVAGAWVLCDITRILSKRHLFAVLAGLLYLAHPAQVEVFHNAVGLGEAASNLLCFTCCWLLLKNRVELAFGATGLYFIALGFKETPIALFPVFVFLIFVYCDFNKRIKWGISSAFVCVIAGYLALRYYVTGNLQTPNLRMPWTLPNTIIERIQLSFYLLGKYTRFIIWPDPLIPERVFEAKNWRLSPWLNIVIGVITMVVGMSGLVVTKSTVIRLGLLTFGLGLVLFLQFFYVQTFFAERHLSLALGGVGLILGGVLTKLWSENKVPAVRIAFTAIILCMVAAYGVRSFIRVGDWGSGLSLWKKAALDAPKSAFARHNYAYFVGLSGRWNESLRESLISTRIDPEFGEAWRTAGMAAIKTGKINDAEIYFKKAMDLLPDDGLSLLGYGLAKYGLGKRDEAIYYFETGFKLKPELKDQFPEILQIIRKK